MREAGAPQGAHGPGVQAFWMKSPMHASVARQHKPSTAALAAPNLVDWGVGPDQREAISAKFPHPFAREPPVEADLQFAIDAYVANGPRVAVVRRGRLRLVKRVARELYPPRPSFVGAAPHPTGRGARSAAGVHRLHCGPRGMA